MAAYSMGDFEHGGAQQVDPTFTTRAEAPHRRSGMSRKDLLKRYRMRLDASKKWRKDYEDLWSRMIDLYRGKQFEGLSPEDRVAVNIAFSTVNVIWPSISVNHPKISIEARQPMFDAQAAITQTVVNYWWRHLDYKAEMRLAVKDSLIVGHGWAKVGWTFQQKERELTPEERTNVVAELNQQADDFAATNPDRADDAPSPEDIESDAPDTTMEVVVDRPFVERVSPFDIYVDPEATCVADLKWIAQRIVMPLEQAQNNKAYRAAARRRLQPDASTNPRWRQAGRESDERYSDDVKRVTLWEYYDLQYGFICVFPEQGDDFLVEPTDFPYAFGMPFVMIRDQDVPDQFYPIGELEAIEPLQHELNKTRSAMMQYRKKYARKYLAVRDHLTPEGRRALESDKDNAIVWIDSDVDPNSVVVPLQQVSIDSNMFAYSDQIESDVEAVSGVSEYQRGALSETRRTATEASIIQDAANARAAEKLASVEDFIREISERLVQLAQQNLQGEQMARIVGPGDAVLWVPFTRDDIQGEFDFEVEAGSTQPRNEMFRRQQALQLAQVLGPYVGVAVNPIELVRYVLREGFGIRNAERFLLAPMLPPMGAPGAPPGGGEGEPQPEAGTTLPLPGQDAIPPNVLTQLQGQVGLDVNNIGGKG